jgi:hypothetical protein
MTNPFAAAISTLVDRIAALTEKASYETARERQALLDEAEALRIGWRVLEAAGKVDKDELLRAIVCLESDNYDAVPITPSVIALLAALPDEKEE